MKAKIYTLYGFGVALGVTGALCGIFMSGVTEFAEQMMMEVVELLMISTGLVLCAFGEKLANKQDMEDKKNG